MAVRVFTLILLLLSTPAFAGLFDKPGQPQFASSAQAFAFDFSQRGHNVTLNWQIKPGYYLYRQQIRVVPQQATLENFELPAGTWHEDEFFGKSQIYPQPIALNLKLISAQKDGVLQVTWQGCAEAGFCYPPETHSVPLSAVAPVQQQPAAASTPALTAPLPSSEAPSAQRPFTMLWALLIGIGVAFTPCVLPMYPLISGIVLGGQRRLSSARACILALIYVQGMALTYTALGLIIAAAGMQFQGTLQQPWVLIGLSALFILLALSMFGVFTLQLPSSLQTGLAFMINRQRGGSGGGVFVMGAIAGLICSPCTTAPLSAILLYIAQSGNVWLGGSTLYLYALGMGLPLILITVFGNRLLPKSGPWMENVKIAFGFIILALPAFLLERVIGDVWGMRLWSLLGLAFFIWAFITCLRSERRIAKVLQIILLGAAIISARPLQDWVFSRSTAQPAQKSLHFSRISNIASFQQTLAKAQGKPVMLDLYADWCVACKEFEKYTFSDPRVQAELKHAVLLQANVTANSADDVALLKHLKVLGLPTILFFDTEGREIPQSRVTGFMKAEAFRTHLHNHLR